MPSLSPSARVVAVDDAAAAGVVVEPVLLRVTVGVLGDLRLVASEIPPPCRCRRRRRPCRGSSGSCPSRCRGRGLTSSTCPGRRCRRRRLSVSRASIVLSSSGVDLREAAAALRGHLRLCRRCRRRPCPSSFVLSVPRRSSTSSWMPSPSVSTSMHRARGDVTRRSAAGRRRSPRSVALRALALVRPVSAQVGAASLGMRGSSRRRRSFLTRRADAAVGVVTMGLGRTGTSPRSTQSRWCSDPEGAGRVVMPEARGRGTGWWRSVAAVARALHTRAEGGGAAGVWSRRSEVFVALHCVHDARERGASGVSTQTPASGRPRWTIDRDRRSAGRQTSAAVS